jgi:hypothetical protein
MALLCRAMFGGSSGPCCSGRPGFQIRLSGAAVCGVAGPREFCTGTRRPRAMRVDANDEQFYQ